MAKAKKKKTPAISKTTNSAASTAPKQKPPSPRGPGGRKPGAEIVLDDRELGKLEGMMGMGLSIEMCAIELGISKSTLDRRISDDPEVRNAVNKGRVSAHARTAKTAFQLANGIGKVKLDSRMTRYWLNCRAGWRETKNLEIDDLRKDQAIDVTPQQRFVKKLADMSPEDVAELLRKKTPTIDS